MVSHLASTAARREHGERSRVKDNGTRAMGTMKVAAWLSAVVILSALTSCVGKGADSAPEKYRPHRISHASDPFPKADARYLEVELDSSSILRQLGRYQSLLHLKLIGMEVQAEDVSIMRALPRLRSLWLIRCRGLNPTLGHLMAAKMPADDVTVFNNAKELDSALERTDSMFLATYLPASRSESVTFAGDSVDSLQWLGAAAECDSTRSVDIRHTLVTQSDILAIARFPKIERVAVSYCELSDVGSIAELANLPYLQHLDFSYSTGMTSGLNRELERLKRDRPSLGVYWSYK